MSDKSNTFSGRHPSQDMQELAAFIALLRERKVTRYLEIGARHGDTFHEVMTALPKGSTGVAMDLPGALWGTHKSRPSLTRAVLDLNKRGYNCTALFLDSHKQTSVTIVQRYGPFDAVLIDGDHTLAGVTRDWELYRDLAPIVAFHDIVGTGQAEKVYGNKVEVPVLWERLREIFDHTEFVARGSAMGIGVLWK